MKLGVHYSAMSEADVPDVLSFWASVPGGIHLLPGEGASSLSRLLRTQPGVSRVVRETEGGTIVGTVCGGLVGVVGTLQHLVVDPGYRRRGIGTELIRQSEQMLRESGAATVFISVLTGNDEATRLWKQLGWRDHPEFITLDKKLR
jgi:ribosomal protein S18 acetylase RimI-like enzyme